MMIYRPMITLEKLEQRVTRIEVRNRKVELDKAWETSLARKLLVAALTYLVVGIFMNTVGVDSPWLNAIVPSVGFALSTLTIPVVKNLWLKFK